MKQPESVAAVLEQARPRRRRKWLVLAAAVLVLGGLGAGTIWLARIQAERRLREVLAETDRLDPGWRFEDLEAKRPTIPDAQNGALRVLAAAQLPNVSAPPTIDNLFRGLKSEKQLDPEQIAALRSQLQKASLALAEARKLADLPHGRYPVTWGRYAINGPFRHIQDARTVAQLLAYDIRLRAQEGDPVGALRSCRAILNAARSFGDEPLLITQLSRVAIGVLAVSNVERTLAQGEPPDADLAACQALLEDEDAQPLLLIAFRGERAVAQQMLEGVEKGDFKPSQILRPVTVGPVTLSAGFLDTVASPFLATAARNSNAAILEEMNELVVIAQLPETEQRSRLEQQLGKFQTHLPAVTRTLTSVNALIRMAKLRDLNHALLRSAAAALTAERYRRQHGRWPKALADLVPGLLKQVPADPYNGEPLRFRRLADGLVIYSVGADGQDNGGNIGVYRPGGDTGVRLWDVAHRRQPLEPLKSVEAAAEEAPGPRSR